MSETQITNRPQTVKDYLTLPEYKLRFQEVLGSRAPQFMSALVSIASQPNLANCEPRSIIASAMVAATLDLPIEKSLGFSHVVPYGNVAQFQMAAKGYVQLALRSAQYQRMNAKSINAEAFGGYDEVGEPKIIWEKLDETKPIIGYVVAWKLTNGFTKVAYWPKEKVEDHASRFSKAYKANRKDSPWFTNFDKMAIKTVVMNELRAWGVLSVQMQTAMKHDMASMTDVDAEPEYIDTDAFSNEADTPPEPPKRPTPPKREAKGVAAVVENNDKKKEEVTEVEATPVPEKETPVEKQTAPATRTTINNKEVVTFVVTVGAVKAIQAKTPAPNSQIMPTIQAKVTGEFEGTVIHFGGAKEVDDELVPDTLWTEGNVISMTVKGREQKDGKVLPLVESISAVEENLEVE